MKKLILWGLLIGIFTGCKSVIRDVSKEVILNNELVEVVRIIYPANTESGMHTHVHPNRVVYVIQGGKLEIIPKDSSKKSRVIIAEKGQALFMPSVTHNVKNIGMTNIILLETEIKND